MSELEDRRQTFLRQARTFRALAKMLSKDPRKKLEAKLCQGLAEVCDGLADLVIEEMERQ